MKKKLPNLMLENEYTNKSVCGIDEVGRGTWAGPVVSAAVIFDKNKKIPYGINDSKKLSKLKREKIYSQILQISKVGIGIVAAAEVDQLGIVQSTLLSMRKAFLNNPIKAQVALIDGIIDPELGVHTKLIIRGDSSSLSIAAASIVAKVTRDNIMADLNIKYPGYGWVNNVGYGTKEHFTAINKLGICKEHRKTFKPIKNFIVK